MRVSLGHVKITKKKRGCDGWKTLKEERKEGRRKGRRGRQEEDYTLPREGSMKKKGAKLVERRGSLRGRGGRTTPFVRKRGESWEVRQRVMHSRPASPKSSDEKTWPTTRTRTRTTSRKVLPSNSLSTLRLPSLDRLHRTSAEEISSSVVFLTSSFFPLSSFFFSFLVSSQRDFNCRLKIPRRWWTTSSPCGQYGLHWTVIRSTVF